MSRITVHWGSLILLGIVCMAAGQVVFYLTNSQAANAVVCLVIGMIWQANWPVFE